MEADKMQTVLIKLDTQHTKTGLENKQTPYMYKSWPIGVSII